MSYLLQQIINGLGDGAIYASLGLALVLIYRTTNIANFAQGEMATFSAYLAWQLIDWGVPFGWALLGSLADVSRYGDRHLPGHRPSGAVQG